MRLADPFGMTVKALGISAHNFGNIETKLARAGGHPLDMSRTYATLNGWQGQDPADYAADYRLVASIKPATNAGIIAPTDILLGKADNLIIPMMDRLLGLPACRKGRHVFAPWHESDTYLPKGGRGTPADVDAAVTRLINLFTARPSFATSNWDISLTITGYALTSRLPNYPKSLALIQALGVRGILAFDEPYGSGADPAEQIGPDLDYIATHYPKLRIQIHECGRANTTINGKSRADWLRQFGANLQTSRYDQVDGICYWNGEGRELTTDDDFAALADLQKTICVPDVAALQRRIDELTAENTGLHNQLDTVQTMLTDARTQAGSLVSTLNSCAV